MGSLNKTAVSATLHCLTGCGIGEVLGMVISSALGWSTAPSIALAVLLAFIFGYALSIRPLLKHQLGIKEALKIAFAADTASITVMEITDNAVILAFPGAIHAELDTLLFWGSLAIGLAVAFVVALPLNRYLISKNKGHALAHKHHNHH